MVVQHNITGMNANRQLNITTGIQAKSSEKLSSGYRINRAADDAAGLAISEKMRRQVRGLTQASANAQDGVSWCQIADGALDEVSNMIARAKELSIQAANETLTDDDRSYINEEMQKMAAEIDRTHAATKFNNIHVFSDEGYSPNTALIAPDEGALSIKLPNGTNVEISLNFIGNDGTVTSLEEAKATGQDTSYGDSEFAAFVKTAAADAVGKLYQNFPTLFEKGASSGIQVGLKLAPGGTGGVLASAGLSISYSNSATLMGYTMYVDTSDYPLATFSEMTDEKKANLAATIAHEMTHLAMYDTLTGGMLKTFPDWFVEGVAQTSSGDGGWVGVNGNSSDAQIASYMSQMKSTVYGAGYLASMYLGHAVSAAQGNTAVNSSNIARGLDKLMGYMAENQATLDQAIAALTGYSGQKDFENHYSSASAKSGVAGLSPLEFTRKLLQETGSGAGSLFGNLGSSELQVFNPNSLSASGTNYTINTNNTQYTNAFGSGYTMPEKADGTATGEGEVDGYGKDLYLQVGSESASPNQILLKRFNVRLEAITEGKVFDTTTSELARKTIDTVNVAGLNVARVRSYYGSLQNRLEHTVKNLDNVVENTQSAESRIRDTEMAAEMVKYSNNNIIAQAGQAILAQANQTNQGVMALLQ